MRRKLVLVTDDESVVRGVVAALIPEEPCLTVAIAASAEVAVQTVAEWQPDLVLLDVAMPGLDAPDLARRLRASPATAGASLVALTPLAGAALPFSVLAAGCDAVVAAPSDAAGTLCALLRGDAAPTVPARYDARRPTPAELGRHTSALAAQAAALVDRSARLTQRTREACDGLTVLLADPPGGRSRAAGRGRLWPYRRG
jgi:CheY-like chemotaxis protein